MHGGGSSPNVCNYNGGEYNVDEDTKVFESFNAVMLLSGFGFASKLTDIMYRTIKILFASPVCLSLRAWTSTE
jgi:hypothetical protein